MSGCIGIGPSAMLFPGARDAVKTPCFYCYYSQSSRECLHLYNATVTLLFRYVSR